MNVLELREKLSNFKNEKQTFINDTKMWVEIARASIYKISENDEGYSIHEINGKTRIINKEDMSILINRINNIDIYNSAYVILISNVEDYFNKIMRLLLSYDNNRIKVTIPNLSMESNIEITDFISNSKEEMINKIIEQRISSIFYASPKKQFEYFDKALGILIDEDNWYKWIEYKARRDVIIHNNSIINEIYFSKVNKYTKFKIGEMVTFDEEEFKKIITFFNNIIDVIDTLIRKEYHIPSQDEAIQFFSKKDLKMLDDLNGEII